MVTRKFWSDAEDARLTTLIAEGERAAAIALRAECRLARSWSSDSAYGLAQDFCTAQPAEAGLGVSSRLLALDELTKLSDINVFSHFIRDPHPSVLLQGAVHFCRRHGRCVHGGQCSSDTVDRRVDRIDSHGNDLRPPIKSDDASLYDFNVLTFRPSPLR